MWTLHARSPQAELIDGHIDSRDELFRSFRDIALANRWFGGTAAARNGLGGLNARSVLDVGCGIGDIATALRDEARRRSQDVHFTGLDSNQELIEAATSKSGGDPGLTFVCGDGTALPYADGAFDAVTCNLALHHFAPDAAIELLREMRRVARIAPVVTDLQRSALALAATYVFSRVFSRNRLTRHDAPLSVRRAYTPAEAVELARRAGWKAPRVRSFRLIRLVLLDAAAL